MIEFAPLAATAVSLLTPLLTTALNKGAEELGKATVTSIIGKLKEQLSHPAAKEALEDLSQQPDDADTQAALRRQLVKALQADPSLAAFLQAWTEEAKPLAARQGITQIANVHGNQSTVIQITGSGHTVNR